MLHTSHQTEEFDIGHQKEALDIGHIELDGKKLTQGVSQLLVPRRGSVRRQKDE